MSQQKMQPDEQQNKKTTPITCRDTTYLVSDARDRQLSATEVRQLEAHIAECPYCQVASQQFKWLFADVDAYLGKT